jgi:intein/homing endonuclease
MKEKCKLSKRNKKVAISRWEREHNKCYNYIKSISKTKKFKILKSRLLGFLAGDGCVHISKEKNKTTTHHVVSFYPDHMSMIKPYVETLNYLYKKNPRIKNEGNYYSIWIYSKPACIDLLKTCKLGTLKWNVPFEFFDSIQTKKEWLRAFFDCESYIGKRQIQLQSVNEKGLIQVQELLKEFEIESKIYKYVRKNKNHNINYILCIMKKESRMNFLNKVSFNHILKFNKLKEQLNASVLESGKQARLE